MAVVLGLAFLSFSFFFFFNDTATTEIYTLSLHDALPISVRVARVATGRSKVVKFEGHFHGVHDGLVAAVKDPFEIPMSAGVPKATLASTLVARHNDLALVTELLSEPEVAAVILEPAGGRSMTGPTNPPFLLALPELTRERGVGLLFDEVLTGLRMAPGGAQEDFGVTAD